MDKRHKITRRDFLKLSGVGAGALALGACGWMPDHSSVSGATALPEISGSTGLAPLAVNLTAGRDSVQILSGPKTPVWRYSATLREGGDPAGLQTLEGSYLGPIFRVRQGQRVQVQLKNEMDDPTIIHWHGLRVPEAMDGHPKYVIGPGKTYSYDFTVRNRAGTYWFHPHPHQMTGFQAYYGLAGMFIVSDEEESALGLPSGEYDLPLVIQDRLFDSANNLVYMSSMMDQMTGFVGDTILVNGKAQAVFRLKSAAYRLRLLNGSNSRIYKLAWQDGTALTVIGTDGGLLGAPVQRDYLMLAPGERAELWVDFSARKQARLVSLAFDAGTMSDMGGMMGGGSSLPNGAALDVASFEIGAETGPASSLPAQLTQMNWHNPSEAVNRQNPRLFTLAMQGMNHTINGRVYEMDSVARDEVVRLGDLEVWEFYNNEGGSGGMGMGMMNMQIPHPMHIHGVQFQVLERLPDENFGAIYQQVSAGFMNEGWKDTVLVMPGERVKVLVRFEDFAGLYLYHCHNLEHEDAGMMRNYRVDG